MKKILLQLFDKKNRQGTFLNGMFILLVWSLVGRIITQFSYSNVFQYESWYISEYLINYQAGFVRRGLLGEILYYFAKSFNFNMVLVIKIFCLVCFALVCLFFMYKFIKKGYSLYILPLCFFLGAHETGINNFYWLKRDHLMFCFLIAIIWAFNNINKSTLKILIINLLMITVLLIHESFAFFSIPIMFFLLINEYKGKGVWKSVVLSLLFLLPSIITFLLTLHYHGDLQTAQTIWNSWVSGANFNEAKLTLNSHSALSAIGWSTKQVMEWHLKDNFLTENMGVVSSVFWPIIFLTVYYIITNVLLVFRRKEAIFTEKDKTIISTILIFQLICLLPFIFFLSCDMGRIIFYWVASAFVIFLLTPLTKMETMFPQFFNKFANKINIFLASIICPTKTSITLLMLFIGIPTVSFSFIKIVESSLIYNVLHVVSPIFKSFSSFFIDMFLKLL